MAPKYPPHLFSPVGQLTQVHPSYSSGNHRRGLCGIRFLSIILVLPTSYPMQTSENTCLLNGYEGDGEGQRGEKSYKRMENVC